MIETCSLPLLVPCGFGDGGDDDDACRFDSKMRRQKPVQTKYGKTEGD